MGNQINLMIASSSIAGSKNIINIQEVLSKDDPLLLESKQLSGLPGVNIDIQRMKDLYSTSLQIVKSSHHEKQLKSIQFIKDSIRKFFSTNSQGVNVCRLWYSGHGHKEGDWAIETIQHPDGDRLTLQDILKLWRERTNKNLGLELYLDSCYSGNWAKRYKAIRQKDDNMWIHCSSGQSQVSWCIPGLGSIFTFYYWLLFNGGKIAAFTPQQMRKRMSLKQYKWIFEKQNPVSISCSCEIAEYRPWPKY